MSDSELFNLVAQLWIANGGDSEGFLYTYLKIYKRIKELEIQEEGRCNDE